MQVTGADGPGSSPARVGPRRIAIRIVSVLALGATAAAGSWYGFQWVVAYASLRQASAAFAAGALPDAAARAAVAIDTGFAPPGAYLLRARVLGARNRPDEALACILAGIDEHPDDVSLRVQRADHLLAAGRLDETLAATATALTLGAQTWKVYAVRGAACYMGGDLTAAATALRRAVELEPTESWPYLLLARALETEESPRAALAVCAVGLQEFPDDPNLINVRGIVRLQAGAPGAALADFDSAIALDASVASFHSGRGQALFALGRYEEALAAFERALELDGDEPGALRGRDSIRHAIATGR